MFIKLFIKLILLSLFSVKLYAHDPKNCDVLQNYDFSGFESWKIEVVNRSNEFGLDEDFVSKLIAPYEVNKRVIENDKCQPEFTLTFSNESPLLYGALAIILAITLGALAAWMRKILSPIVKKLLSDFRNKNQPKKEEVKFPEK